MVFEYLLKICAVRDVVKNKIRAQVKTGKFIVAAWYPRSQLDKAESRDY